MMLLVLIIVLLVPHTFECISSTHSAKQQGEKTNFDDNASLQPGPDANRLYRKYPGKFHTIFKSNSLVNTDQKS